MKVVLTESQVKKLVENVKQLNEGVSDTYSKEVKVDIYAPSNVLYKGNEINNIPYPTIKLNYNIEIDAREWGIKDVSLYGIEGENELEIEVDYWVDGSETDSQTENTILQLNWENLKTESNTGEGVVTIGDTLEIRLANDENGNLIVEEMTLPIYTL